MATEQPTLKERKEALEQEAEKYKHELKDKVGDLKQNANQVGKAALVLGGAALAGYLIVKAVRGRRSDDDEPKTETDATRRGAKGRTNRSTKAAVAAAPVAAREPDSLLVRMIKENIAIFLIAIAKKQLAGVFDRLTQHDEDAAAEPAPQPNANPEGYQL